jgi:Multicopper oxidase
MYTKTRQLFATPPRRLATALLFALAGLGGHQAQATTLTSTACTSAAGVATCTLFAKSGTMTLPSTTVSVWGYTDSASGVITQPGGPILIVNQGDAVTVNLTNSLPEATTLMFHGQSNVTSPTATSYTFTATNPGTYLYEASPIGANTQHQTAMGLYGALVVKPACALAPCQAYGDLPGGAVGSGAATLYDDEAVVLLSELDPALNAAPATFDIRNFAPQYFLINGKFHPNTDAINAPTGHKVLLRYVNAGVQQHSMGLLGLRQNFVAKDGSPLPMFTHSVVAESIAPGETGDAIATIPTGLANGIKYPLYDARFMMHNSSNPGMGGMLTFLTVGPGTGTSAYPITSGVALAPNPTTGLVQVLLSAAIASDPAIATASVSAAEYFIDATGTGGTGCAMTGTTAASATIPVNISATSTCDLTGLAAGNHTIYVHGQQTDTAAPSGTLPIWGAFASATLQISAAGPTTGAVSVTPNPADGTAIVTVSAPITSPLTGITVAGAEYFIDGTPGNGTGTAMTGTFGAASATATVSIPAATIALLTGGNHTISVHGLAGGNSSAWGAFSTATLTVNQTTGPVTSLLSVTPNPTNGSAAELISATATSAAAAEYFLDNATPAVTTRGNTMTVVGTSLTASIPAVTVGGLASGDHTISVRSRNASGNWGAIVTAPFTVDKIGPVTSGLSAAPAASNGVQPIVLNATFTDDQSNVTGAEYFIDSFGAVGTGTAMTLSNPVDLTRTGTASVPGSAFNALVPGNHNLIVRSRDIVGNWGSTVTTPIVVDKLTPTFTSVTPATSTIAFGTASISLTINGVNGTGTNVVGGDYWFDSATVPAVTTPFTGLPATIVTSSLTGGQHTVRLRIKDAAGNLSVVSNSITVNVLQAINNAYAVNANTSNTPQTVSVNTANGVLTNDQPTGVAGRTATIVAGSLHRIDNNNGTGASAGTGTIGVTLNANGSFSYTLTAPASANTNILRQNAKRGHYSFTYTETLNGVISAPATVTITVN